MVQLSHPYMTTGKTIALTRWTFVGKVMSLVFNMLPRFVIAFLSRSKYLLISWLQSSSAVIWGPKKIKSVTVYIVSPSISQLCQVRNCRNIPIKKNFFSSVQFIQFSRSVMSDSLRSHELQHARPPCPSLTPGVHSNSCPSSR